MRVFTSKDGKAMQRRVTWNLADWPRVRDLQESLDWVRSRLQFPEPASVFDEPIIQFDTIVAQTLELPR